MTSKERMLATLRFEEDRIPHFETVFQLTQEAFGEDFPSPDILRSATLSERDNFYATSAALYAKIVDRYQWDALALWHPWADPAMLPAARKVFGDSILLGIIIGDTIWSIESIRDWDAFAADLADAPERVHAVAEEKLQRSFKAFDCFIDNGADFIHLVNDVAFNAGPFVSPAHFREFVTPYLHRAVAYIKARGVLAFVHTDGNIMPVIDDYLSLGADLFQSVDPMAGMDMAKVKAACHGKLPLMGNVQCSLLQEGPAAAIRQSARYCLEHGSPGGGYIFATSNTIFKGMPLANYDCMLNEYRAFNAERVVKRSGLAQPRPPGARFHRQFNNTTLENPR